MSHHGSLAHHTTVSPPCVVQVQLRFSVGEEASQRSLGEDSKQRKARIRRIRKARRAGVHM